MPRPSTPSAHVPYLDDPERVRYHLEQAQEHLRLACGSPMWSHAERGKITITMEWIGTMIRLNKHKPWKLFLSRLKRGK